MITKLRICHICSYYENVLFDNLVSAQISYTEPRVFFFKKYGQEKQYSKEEVDEVQCYSNIDRVFFFIKARKVFRKYQEIYKGKSFDLLFAHSLFANGVISYLVNKKHGIKYIVMVQNTDINFFYKLKPYLSGIALKIMLNASKIVFASTTYKNCLITNHIPSKYKMDIAAKAVVIPYGIEEIFYRNEKKPEHMLNGNIHIICVALICKNKNQTKLAEAINRLNHKGYCIDLTIIGKNGDNHVMSELRKYDFINIVPYMNKNSLIEEYRKADLFALVSITETFGLVYAEALSQGLPIIYSKGQGFDEQFEDGFVGYPADASSIASISKTIKKVIQEYDIIQKNTLQASKKFKWDIISKEYRKMYESIFMDENICDEYIYK